MKYVLENITAHLKKINRMCVDGGRHTNVDFTGVWKVWSRWGFLFLIVMLYLYRAMGYISPTITPDAETTYLPYAQKIIDQGFGFLFHTDSILVAPMTYFWPALFGGKVLVVKYANLISGVFMVLLTFGIASRLHSHAAGLIAAFLFARSPLIIHWIPTVLSEPPFYLFTLMWFWAIGGVLLRKKWAIPIASIALALSILTRPIWLYPSVFFLIVTLIWYWLKPQDRNLSLNIVIMLAMGLVLPVAMIIKNIIFFNFPSIAIGSGLALYMGSNPMTGGVEPPILGLSYASGINPMSILGNQEHMTVAIEFLKDRSLFELLEWFIQKISWTLMFSPLDSSIKASLWRAIELAMMFVGLRWGIKKKSYFIMILGAGLVLQTLQTSLVLYNVRYSTDNIELLLVPLAAVGIAVSLRMATIRMNYDYTDNFLFKTNNFLDYRKFGVILIFIFLSIIYFKIRPIPKISLGKNIPVTTLFEKTNKITLNDLPTTGTNQNKGQVVKLHIPKQVRPEIRPGEESDVLWKIRMAISEKSGGSCKRATIGFSPATSTKKNFYSTNIPINDDGSIHSYYIGTTYSNSALFPKNPGRLILEFDCPAGDDIQIEQIALVAPHFIEYYWNKAVH